MDRFFIANAEFAKFSRNYMEHKKELPIRPSEMGVLNIITGMKGPHTAVHLAELLEVSKPMITAHITTLMEKGYITKEQSSDDKRVFFIHPTKKALELVESAKKDTDRQLEQVMVHLGEEAFDQLIQLVKEANLVMSTNRTTKKERKNYDV